MRKFKKFFTFVFQLYLQHQVFCQQAVWQLLLQMLKQKTQMVTEL